MKRLALCALIFSAVAQAQTGGFAQQCWRRAEPVFRKALEHPFLQELASGKLQKEKFRFYLEQDLLYLREFSRLLLELAAKAPRGAQAQTLARHANEAIAEEAALHGEILGLSDSARTEFPDRFTMSPTNLAYVNHLRTSVGRGSFLEGMAAVLPCYWYYLEAGKELAKKGSPVPEYQQWIRQYSGPDYGKSVREALEIFEAAAAGASPAERERAARIFETSARYEWMFWDMAWRMERWPPVE
ncbi:MAG: thiaminase II [Bryobacteraceae bacterium]|nr:thiaminase II [Bryobacteraceae bacterium]MCX7604273.1 thiaminase II [Bryobacteraceae bacterium]